MIVQHSQLAFSAPNSQLRFPWPNSQLRCPLGSTALQGLDRIFIKLGDLEARNSKARLGAGTRWLLVGDGSGMDVQWLRDDKLMSHEAYHGYSYSSFWGMNIANNHTWNMLRDNQQP